VNLPVLKEIKQGYSSVSSFFMRHQSIDDECIYEEMKEKYYALAIKRGVKSEKEQIGVAIKRGSWSEEQERKLNAEKIFLRNMQDNYDKQAEGLKKLLAEDINKSYEKVCFLQRERNKLCSETAEHFSDKITSEKFLLSLFYKSSKLDEPLFSKDDMDYMEEADVKKYKDLFYESVDKFRILELKSLACSSYFQNLYSTAKGPIEFFGKPTMDLTNYQQTLLMYAEYFKSIISNLAGKVKAENLSDYEYLEEWVKSDEKTREAIENSSNRGSSGGLNKASIRKNADKTKDLSGDEKIKSVSKLVG